MWRTAYLLTLCACVNPRAFEQAADRLAPQVAREQAAVRMRCPPDRLALERPNSQLDEALGRKTYWYSVEGCQQRGELRAECDGERCRVELLHLERVAPVREPVVEQWELPYFVPGANRGERPWPLPNSALGFSSTRCLFSEAPRCTASCRDEPAEADDARAKKLTCAELRPQPLPPEATAQLGALLSGRAQTWPEALEDSSLHRLRLVLRSGKCAEGVEQRLGLPGAFVRQPEGGTLTGITVFRQAGVFRPADAPRPEARTLTFTLAAGSFTRDFEGTRFEPTATPWGQQAWAGAPRAPDADAGAGVRRTTDAPREEWSEVARAYGEPQGGDAAFEAAVAQLMAGNDRRAIALYRQWASVGGHGSSSPRWPESVATFGAFFDAVEAGRAWVQNPCPP